MVPSSFGFGRANPAMLDGSWMIRHVQSPFSVEAGLICGWRFVFPAPSMPDPVSLSVSPASACIYLILDFSGASQLPCRPPIGAKAHQLRVPTGFL